MNGEASFCISVLLDLEASGCRLCDRPCPSSSPFFHILLKTYTDFVPGTGIDRGRQHNVINSDSSWNMELWEQREGNQPWVGVEWARMLGKASKVGDTSTMPLMVSSSYSDRESK